MINNRVAIVTAYIPDPLNENGGPSGLLWEIINYLNNELNIETDVIYKPISKNTLIRVLQRNGLYISKCENKFDSYKYIIVYPDDVLFYVNRKYWHKVIILGPDSPSLRDARDYRTKKIGIKKIIKYLMFLHSRYNEYIALKYVHKFIVVGKTDSMYMRSNPLINKDAIKKIVFLRHPVLSSVVKQDSQPTKGDEIDYKRFVFSITPKNQNFMFIKKVIEQLARYSANSKKKMHILLVGERSKWMYELFSNISMCVVEYLPWAARYSDICLLKQDVHCLPLLSGAGTKNRTLTALAFNLEIITTPIGIENIPWRQLTGIYIAANPKKFADYMIQVNDDELCIDYIDVMKQRSYVCMNIKEQFQLTLREILGDTACKW